MEKQQCLHTGWFNPYEYVIVTVNDIVTEPSLITGWFKFNKQVSIFISDGKVADKNSDKFSPGLL